MKNKNIAEHVGFTQQEMAGFLGVHASQWSMYACGLRNLPLPAKQKLAALLAHLQSAGKAAKPVTDKKDIGQAHVDHLTALLHENAYQQQLTQRKIDALVKKQTAQARRQQVIDFMAAQEKEEGNGGAIRAVAARSEQSRREDIEGNLMKLRYKKEWLEAEKAWIESKIKNPGGTPVNKGG